MEKSFEHENRPLPTLFAALNGLVKIEHRQAIGLTESVNRISNAVTIRIGFDHPPHKRPFAVILTTDTIELVCNHT